MGDYASEGFSNPVGDVVTRVDTVVEAGVLNTAFSVSENLQFAFGAVDQLLVRAVRPLQRNLRVLLTMRDEKWNADLLDHTIQVHVLGDAHEIVDVLCAP